MFICFLIAYVRCLIQSQIAVIIFCRHGASEGLLIFGEGGGYESVKQNVSDDGEFSELYLFHADIEVALHNSLFYFSLGDSLLQGQQRKCILLSIIIIRS
jgi:hypothetical protein